MMATGDLHIIKDHDAGEIHVSEELASAPIGRFGEIVVTMDYEPLPLPPPPSSSESPPPRLRP